MTRNEKTVIFSTKKGVIVEWNRDENKAENIYNLDDAINDFCLSDDQGIIFCPTEKGTLWCIDRNRNITSKIDMSIERRWGSIDIKDNKIVLSSIEGALCLYDIKKNEATLLQDDTGKYIIPFLHMEGCSFKNLHSMSDLDERLKDDLRIQGVDI